MIGIALFLLAEGAGSLPPISLTCERDQAGNCVLDYSLKPLRRLAEADWEHAAVFYEPYFDCYYDALTHDVDFGASDAALATGAMVRAGEDCVIQRLEGDQKLDALIAERGVYGDNADRAFVRNSFRQEVGSRFVFAKAQGDGLGEKLLSMSNAYIDGLLDSK